MTNEEIKEKEKEIRIAKIENTLERLRDKRNRLDKEIEKQTKVLESLTLTIE
jgi:predicted ribosome quality control (RQC) complex YloA/Tae2 family protein